MEEVGILDSVLFHSHGPLLDPNPVVFYQILTQWGTYRGCLMLMFSSISGLRDGETGGFYSFDLCREIA